MSRNEQCPLCFGETELRPYEQFKISRDRHRQSQKIYRLLLITISLLIGCATPHDTSDQPRSNNKWPDPPSTNSDDIARQKQRW